MVFASLEFLSLFLPLFLGAYALVRPAQRNALLLFGSWLFYGWWSPTFLLMFIGLAGLGWVGGLVIARFAEGQGRGIALSLFIAINLGLLCWFKYANIVVESLAALLGPGAMPADWQRVALPIGLSFIVLQSISYLADVYRRTVPADPSFTSFGAYQSMFVHLIAGPIIRYEWVKRELVARPFDWPQFAQGARRFMVGMSMKVLIADSLAPVADLAFSLPAPTLADSWAGCIAYSLQLFFDFAGYSGMAIGLGLMLGFRFPENFRQPYLASSIQDFWRRWHLSLSSWIRDYLYIPFGGNRVGALRIYVNLLLTMAIAGLWHGGDSWNFLLWGAAHGARLDAVVCDAGLDGVPCPRFRRGDDDVRRPVWAAGHRFQRGDAGAAATLAWFGAGAGPGLRDRARGAALDRAAPAGAGDQPGRAMAAVRLPVLVRTDRQPRCSAFLVFPILSCR